MSKPKPAPDRAKVFKTIAGRIRLISKKRSPAVRSVYAEAAAILDKEAKKHAAPTKN